MSSSKGQESKKLPRFRISGTGVVSVHAIDVLKSDATERQMEAIERMQKKMERGRLRRAFTLKSSVADA